MKERPLFVLTKVDNNTYSHELIHRGIQIRLRELKKGEVIGIGVTADELALDPPRMFRFPIARLSDEQLLNTLCAAIVTVQLKRPFPSFDELSKADIDTLERYCDFL